MKTKYYLIAWALATLAFFSCNREKVVPEEMTVPAGEMTFYATLSDTRQTKTAIVNETEIWWSPGDAIKVFYGNLTSGKFTASTTKASATSTFTGSLSMVTGSVEVGSEARSFWAAYPYDAQSTCDGSSVTVAVPVAQTGAAGTFAPKTFPAIATSSGLDLAFYNVCGGMVFTVTRDDIRSVTLCGNNNEIIAGNVRVSFDEGIPAVREIISGEQSITLTAPNSSPFVSGTRYFITALPSQFSKGYSLTFTTSSGQTGTKTVADSKVINRSRFLMVNNADSDVSFSGGITPSNVIEFADPKVKEKLVAAFDTSGDGELSYEEAAAVTSGNDLKAAFGAIKTYKSFDEFQYFTCISSLAASMFENWNLLSSIILPITLTYIPTSSFSGCSSLTSITIPDSVTSIGESAFNDCTGLTSFTIPESVKNIGGFAFSNCTNLTSLTIPEGVTRIQYYTFGGCSSLTSITIPESVTSIGRDAFLGCSSLTNITIPESVTSIESDAFIGCSSLTSITIPERVSSIGNYTFFGCSSLSSITIPESVSSIGNYAFYGCSSLTSITIPESVTSIGDYAFYGCTSLSSITIPESVSSIGNYAFYGCSSLNSITIPASVTSIGITAFYECRGLTSITVLSKIPPIGNMNMFQYTTAPIYVPVGSVEAYKSAEYWSGYASRIQAIPE